MGVVFLLAGNDVAMHIMFLQGSPGCVGLLCCSSILPRLMCCDGIACVLCARSMAARLHSLALPSVGELVCWHVAVGGRVRKGSPLCSYTTAPGTDHTQLKSAVVGVVRELLATEGAAVEAG